ncbi:MULTISPECIES: PepSY domain-containing protein [unclassified Pseudomonas]|uniref:PepSY domain-containing protein n=1 Tax=unclassified Pseudomonas TaxID=196821 RepID=UPI0010551032|nr:MULTISPECIES: PepSY domain-containing protein [unclassified Pseudomonas]KAA0943898.1 peptidase M4 [Pseudomonas sp. ANT_H4]KAA0950988.1 peptidase M4 [Pseudomonas sp. ANT_H14]
MKKLTALFAATALTLTAGLAQADVRPDQIPGLLKSGAVMDFEKLNAAALAKHPGATIVDTELEDKAGRLIYQTELRDTSNVKWDVDLDAKTGEVLTNKQDT